MMKINFAAATCFAALALSHASAQTAMPAAAIRPAEPDVACMNGAPLIGLVHDTSGATVAEAAVTLDGNAQTQTATDGHFRFACVAAGPHHLQVKAESFAAFDLELAANAHGNVAVELHPDAVSQSIDVSGDEEVKGVDNKETGAARTLKGDDLKMLADDPDDLLRELQQLAAGSGGNPSDTLITVDGFQDATRLPPKSSIAYIKVNPDLFAAEYQEPPYTGGRVEVYTKPGQPRLHGSLFTTNSGSAFNARDPFSVSKGTIGKQRYGADLSGPIRRQGSDFALSLEHRSIDNVAVVNGINLDANGNQVSVNETSPAPLRLWEASARMAWQLGPKNTFIANYTANDNNKTNVGVGGTTLTEAGYNDHTYEHVLRLTNVTTANANLMHEARVSFRWSADLQAPNSSAAQVQVAGAFTGGGSAGGPQQTRDFVTEIIDDAIWTQKNHTWKFGTNTRIYRENIQATQNFNGLYTFGGGTAPVLDANGNVVAGQSTTISGLEQYRRAKLNLPGGAATAFQQVAGSPAIRFTQVRAAFYVQDEWKLRPNLKLSYGLRYFTQNNPNIDVNVMPRAGIAWSPDKKQTWTIKLHSGLFNGSYSTSSWTELQRLDGVHRVSSIVYSPVFGNPLAGATAITTMRTLAPHLGNGIFSEQQAEIDKSLSHGWNVQGTFYWIRGWNFGRSDNINSPLNQQPTGPRPIAPNMNILQVQNSGSMKGDIEFVSVEQHTIKFFSLFFGYARVDLRDDVNNDTFFTPQQSGTDAGEYARRTNSNQHQFFGNATLHIPLKVDLSSNWYGASGNPYNITTGFDNNGDGNFNDRPRYALPGDPNAIQTRYGLLVSTGGTGVVPRNTATTSYKMYMDANLQRTFTLTPHAKKDAAQTLAVNVRSANVLNHTNVTAQGGVLGSPLFGVPYQADSGRRVEIGARYSF